MLGHVAQSVGGALPGVGSQISRLIARECFIARGGAATNNSGLAPDTNGSWVAPYDCFAEVVLHGAGAGGTTGDDGGGGGAALGRFDPFLVMKGQSIDYAIPPRSMPGTAGRRATVNLPDGRVGICPGGNQASAPIGGYSEPPTGFDLGSRGGNRKTSGENNGASSFNAARCPGGVGGLGPSLLAFPDVTGTSGTSGSPGSGGNGASSGNGGQGGDGRIAITFWSLP